VRFTVVWEPDAESDLTSSWLAASQELRELITAANAYFDRALSQNAHQKGTNIRGVPQSRLLVAPPVAGMPAISVAFEVIVDDRLVRVVQFKLTELD